MLGACRIRTMEPHKPDLLRLSAVALSVTLLVAACAGTSTEPSSSSKSSSVEPTTSSSQQSVITAPVSSSTTVDSEFPSWVSSTLVEMDPISLAPVGPAIPAGLWTEGSAVTDDLIAVATWPLQESERADARWRLVVASRDTGEVIYDERVGVMNVLGMFSSVSGEVMIVEPVRSADWNFADGFVVRGFNPETAELSEVARFDEGDFFPSSLTLLSDGRLGVVGSERTGDVLGPSRIVAFDWQTNETVTDVTLDDLPLNTEAPEGVFVESMHHPLMWDEARSRALVVHAHEDVITTVAIPSGEVQHVPLETLDVVSRHDEANLTSEYQVQVAPAEKIIYVEGARGTILTFDPTSGSLRSTDATGFEPALLRNSLRYASQSN
jgi:hypothetical protein